MAVKSDTYPAMDRFRLIAALLVVAIHTSPFFSLSPAADFALTGIIGRLAVPFFFISSGFFLRSFSHFLRKTLLAYAVAVLLYLPLNIYAGSFSLNALLWDGTFYHLWYFPAVLWGMLLAQLLFRNLPRPAAYGIAAGLYILGLMGDSYYNLLVAYVPALARFAGGILALFGTTRNGLFFAPLFLLMGLDIAWRKRSTRGTRFWGLAVAGGVAALLCEGFLLYSTVGLHNDVMYLSLPFCIWALFRFLSCFHGGTEKPAYRSVATLVYILHPWAIALLLPLGRLAGLPAMMETHSLLFFLLAAIASFGVSSLLVWLWLRKRGDKKTPLRAEVCVSSEALRHNLREIRTLLPAGSECMAVVKADAYGHGAVPVCRTLAGEGVTAYAVATIEEGIALRRAGLSGDILVLGYTATEHAGKLHRYGLCQTVISRAHAEALSKAHRNLHVHIKVDTGMHRAGMDWQDLAGIAAVYNLPGLRVEGIYTHFSRADSLGEEDASYTQLQASRFYELLERLRGMGIQPGKTHLQSSYGLLNHPTLCGNYARIGLALYGALNHNCPTLVQPNLQPALTLRAPVASVTTRKAGDSLGYMGAYTCETNSRIAQITIGYADGVPRGITGGHVLLHGKPAPIVGRINMDSLLADVSGIPAEAPGDIATLIGTDGQHIITAGEVAQQAGTIPNEILVRLGMRLYRRYR